MLGEPNFRIFVSTAYRDRELVQPLLVTAHETLGSKFEFLDSSRVELGVRLDVVLGRWITQADLFLIVVTPAFLASTNCLIELGRILQRAEVDHIPVIPIVMTSVEQVPPSVTQYQFLWLEDDFELSDWQKAGWSNVTDRVRDLAAKRDYPAKYPKHQFLARIEMRSEGPTDFQAIAANLVEISRIHTALRLIDSTSASFNSKYLSKPATVHGLSSQSLLDEDERLEVLASGQRSPPWYEVGQTTIGFLTVAVVAWQAVMATLAHREQVRRNREDRRWRVYEVLRREFLPQVLRNGGVVEDQAMLSTAEIINGSIERLSISRHPVERVLLPPDESGRIERISDILGSSETLAHREE